MGDWLKAGVWRHILLLPPVIGTRRAGQLAERARAEVGALSEQQRAVHHFVVRELPRVGASIKPEVVAEGLNLPLADVVRILDELEAKKAFLFRDDQRAVVWAYPVTAAKTPHRLSFKSGERLYAAWAADAIATPFVQGRLRSEDLAVRVESECHHCGRPLTLEIDSDMNCRVEEAGAAPVVFIPDVDPFGVAGPSIVDDFWRENVFFWSEEHAREYRKSTHRIRGVYSPLDRVAAANRIVQSAVFGFDVGREGWFGTPKGIQAPKCQAIDANLQICIPGTVGRHRQPSPIDWSARAQDARIRATKPCKARSTVRAQLARSGSLDATWREETNMKQFKNGLLAVALGLTLVLAAPVTAQDTDLISSLVSQLGISEAQAAGGVQAILGTTKGKLSPTDYTSLLSGAPSLAELAEGMGSEAAESAMGSAAAAAPEAPAAPPTAAVPGTGLGSTDVASATSGMASMGDTVGSAGDALGGLDTSSLSQLTGLTSQFTDLGLDAGMVQKFVPALLQHFGKDSATSSLLMKGLGLL